MINGYLRGHEIDHIDNKWGYFDTQAIDFIDFVVYKDK